MNSCPYEINNRTNSFLSMQKGLPKNTWNTYFYPYLQSGIYWYDNYIRTALLTSYDDKEKGSNNR